MLHLKPFTSTVIIWGFFFPIFVEIGSVWFCYNKERQTCSLLVHRRHPPGEVGTYSQNSTRDCLDCICQASTKCKLDQGCHNAGPDAYFCGPYTLSYAYWVDAGKPGEANIDHFEKCLKDKKCSELTIVQYMNKWGTDCDGDGRITCYDYARIHKGGRNGCPAKWVDDTDYWTGFTECMELKSKRQ
ncbi:invertebrate-type lysozyme 6-like isoform X2 [Varroa jacobsoni]|uniref:invertebrate-type lysozyme 6-like isoform X2 n=1 Tax=Varroa jacobsoni TaxID=62625 RepID=UPI000BF25292|nr:invertebrate-type lysozyme 6-like isoform X2 [Varroa jacobsoni]